MVNETLFLLAENIPAGGSANRSPRRRRMMGRSWPGADGARPAILNRLEQLPVADTRFSPPALPLSKMRSPGPLRGTSPFSTDSIERAHLKHQ
jgi:hypothetical protein